MTNRKKYRRRLAKCLRDMYTLWPALKQRLPLARGVHRQIIIVLAERYPAWLVRRALHDHCSLEPYLKKVSTTRYRHDLFGAPTGEMITNEQRLDAQLHLEARRRKRLLAKSRPPQSVRPTED